MHDGDSKRCHLVLLDAQKMEEGPVAVLDAGPLSPWGRLTYRELHRETVK